MCVYRVVCGVCVGMCVCVTMCVCACVCEDVCVYVCVCVCGDNFMHLEMPTENVARGCKMRFSKSLGGI